MRDSWPPQDHDGCFLDVFFEGFVIYVIIMFLVMYLIGHH